MDEPCEIVHMNGGTFDIGVDVIFTRDLERAKDYVNATVGGSFTTEDFIVRGATFYNKGYDIVIWLPQRPETVEELSVANHELFHATVSVLDWANLSLNSLTEEVYAYEMQHLSRQFYGR